MNWAKQTNKRYSNNSHLVKISPPVCCLKTDGGSITRLLIIWILKVAAAWTSVVSPSLSFTLISSTVYLILKSSSLPLGHALIPSLSGSYCSSSIGFIWCTFKKLFGFSDPFEQNATVKIGKFGLLCTNKGFFVAALPRNLLLNYFPGAAARLSLERIVAPNFLPRKHVSVSSPPYPMCGRCFLSLQHSPWTWRVATPPFFCHNRVSASSLVVLTSSAQ